MSNPEVETPALEVVEDSQLSHVFDPALLARSIEAILMVVDEPVTELTLASVLQVTVDQVVDALEALVPSYEDRGFSLKAINGGWRFYSHPDCSAVVEKFVLDGQQNRLTQAALETLAVIAYRQPVSRARVSAIRGVNVEASVAVFNDFTNPLYFLPGSDNATVQLTLFYFQSAYLTQYNLLFTDILLITIPPLIVFIIFNKKIVSGLTAGSVKG